MLIPTFIFTFCPSKFEPRVKKRWARVVLVVSVGENLLSHHDTGLLVVLRTGKWFPLLLKCRRRHESPVREKLKHDSCLTGVNVTRPCKESVLIHLVFFFILFFSFLEQKEQQFGLSQGKNQRQADLLQFRFSFGSGEGFTDLECLLHSSSLSFFSAEEPFWQSAARIPNPKSASGRWVLCQRADGGNELNGSVRFGVGYWGMGLHLSLLYLLVCAVCSILGNEGRCLWRRQGQSACQYLNYSSDIGYTTAFLPESSFSR